MSVSLIRKCLAEAFGLFIIVFFGLGVVNTAVLVGAQAGLWQVAIVWGIAVTLAIYATGAISGAHLNPAVTIALALFRKFPAKNVIPYIISQLIGAFVAACVIFLLFSNLLSAYESDNHIIRGKSGSELSAMLYCDYFPNPELVKNEKMDTASVTGSQAFSIEALGTALLVFMIFVLTDANNKNSPQSNLAPVFIGLTVSAIISAAGPLSQAGINPARDFGPRLFAYFAGWGRIALPGPKCEAIMVYTLAPIIGAVVGGGVYTVLFFKNHVKSLKETLE